MAADVEQPSLEPVRQPDLGGGGAARWIWRQLTSMRVALLLLFLLAAVAVPGSLFPQRGVAPLRVDEYYANSPTLARWLDALSLFDVYAAPWFAAVYLLLMLSLAGCIVPRIVQHTRSITSAPPRAPRRLTRLPTHASAEVVGDAQQVLAQAESVLRGQRFRVRPGDGDAVAAEKGYLREAGNLVFHVSLLVMLVGIAWGSLFGFRGTVVVVEGEGFANTLSQYDTFVPGRRVDPADLEPFAFQLDELDATFLTEGPIGQPESFSASVTVVTEPGGDPMPDVISVNDPLGVNGTKVFLLGTGYAPVFTVRDGDGNVAFSGPVPTLPQDAAFTSTGVVKVPDAAPEQLGFQVRFTPTAPERVDPMIGPASTFPEANAPRVFVGAWAGDLGLDDGVPQNIYQLDTEGLEQLGNEALDPGETWQLPDGRGSLTFDGVSEWGNFQVSRDPGRWLVLLAAAAAIAGVTVSLVVRRRRLWVRATPGAAGRTLVEVAGLARTEDAGLGPEVDQLLTVLVDSASSDAPSVDSPAAPAATNPPE